MTRWPENTSIVVQASRLRLCYAVLLTAAFCCSAAAQQALVATTAESVTREHAGVYLQRVDFSTSEVLPDTLALRGEAPAGPLLLSADGSLAILPSGPDPAIPTRDDRCYASFAAPPFTASSTIAFENGWRQTAACLVGGAAGFVAATGYRAGQYTLDNGVLYAFVPPAEPYSTAPAAALAELPLPGEPAAIAPLPSGDRVAVLLLKPDNCAVGIVVVDLARGEIVDEVQNLADEARQMSTAPGGIAISKGGRTLFALVTGYAIGQRSGEAVSWLYALDPENLAYRSGPLELPGVAEPADEPIQPAGANACWVATRPRGSDFAYATLATPTGDALERAAQLPFTGVSETFSVAAEPGGAGVAAAVDDCVQIRAQNGEVRASWAFKSHVHLLRWTTGGLMAGEAGRIHLLDPAAPDAVASVQLQTGHVVDAALLPGSPITEDDSGPPAGRLQLPLSVAFRGEAVGQEVKALLVQPSRPADSWQIDYDRAAMPWLVIHPTAGIGTGVAYMGVDPAWYRPGSTEEGLLRARLTPPPQDVSVPPEETVVELRILPEERFDVRRILWIWEDGGATSFRDRSDPRGLRALAQLLAGPPYYLAHREVAGTFQESLEPYAVVVLDAGAAARGVVTRRAVLDYVRGGGALLFLGRHLPGTTERELTQWLAPMGIQIDARALVEGVFPANSDHWLTRHWAKPKIANGCAIYTDYPEAVRVPGPEGTSRPCIFMARTYGRGRLAALASKSPLESHTLESRQHRLFAADLFCWLAGADKHLENQDMDSDGLPDDIEDANGNGITERNETDFLKNDSDGDGLPDGIEDANMNGLPDEGETDPLNADSDGDGVQDGADESPAPPAGAPVLHSVQPDNGPAEGGTAVVVSGRNLPADAAVWFGERPSPSVRVVDATELVAETPAFPDPAGGRTPVRVTSRAGDVEGTFTRGFLYTPRSTVRLALATLDLISRQDAMYTGKFAVRLEKPPDVSLENVTLVLAPDPPASVQWPRDMLPAPQPGRPMMRPLQSGELLVAVLNAGKLPESAKLAIVPWRVEGQLPRIRIKHALVYAHNGQILEAQTRDLPLAAAAAQAKRSP